MIFCSKSFYVSLFRKILLDFFYICVQNVLNFLFKKSGKNYDFTPFKYALKVKRSDITACCNNTAPMVYS